MTQVNAIYAEIRRVEAVIESPAGKGRVTALKAYARKLYAEARRLSKAGEA